MLKHLLGCRCLVYLYYCIMCWICLDLYHCEAVRMNSQFKMVMMMKKSNEIESRDDMVSKDHSSGYMYGLNSIFHADRDEIRDENDVNSNTQMWISLTQDALQDGEDMITSNNNGEYTKDIISQVRYICESSINQTSTMNQTSVDELKDKVTILRLHIDDMQQVVDITMVPLITDYVFIIDSPSSPYAMTMKGNHSVQGNVINITDNAVAELKIKLENMIIGSRNVIGSLNGMYKSLVAFVDDPIPHIQKQNGDWCFDSFLPSLSGLEQKSQVESLEETPTTTELIMSYVLSSLAGLIGLFLVGFPPHIGKYINSVCIFYGFGVIGYATSYYWTETYKLSQISTDYLTYFLIDYAAGAIAGLLGSIIFSNFCSNLGYVYILGLSFGIVFGLQAFAFGLYMLTPTDQAVYFTIVVTLAGSLLFFSFLFLLIGIESGNMISNRTQILSSFLRCWLGGYWIVKMIAVPLNSYPNEYALSLLDPMIAPTTTSLICLSFMIVISVTAFILQWFCCSVKQFGGSPAPRPRKSSYSSPSDDVKESMPLLKSSEPKKNSSGLTISQHRDNSTIDRNSQRRSQPGIGDDAPPTATAQFSSLTDDIARRNQISYTRVTSP